MCDKRKNVIVVGAARSGVAAANLALSAGFTVGITDSRNLVDIEKALAGLDGRDRVDIESGGHTPDFLKGKDLVIASPGVRYDAVVLQWARSAGIPVCSEIEFAWSFCRRPVVAVTGSNGKTTTSTLIARVLESAGKKVCLCGNIGVPFSRCVLDEKVDVFVVEISSFQLELTETFCPHVALITNFSQNHLDRHANMQEYFEAKKRIFMNQTPSDFALINARDEWSLKLVSSLAAQVVSFNQAEETGNSNELAALAVGRIFCISEEFVRSVLASFSGVEHRLEMVRKIDGVEYINDSKSTTVEAGRWALMNVPGPLIVICGGKDKGMDCCVLKDLVKKTVKKMIILTRDSDVRRKLHEAFENIVPLEDHIDMSMALHSARAQAVSGDKVLLTPLFASFDMFDNFEHRGDVFKEIVNRF